MPDRPTPAATVVSGWVQFAGEPSWNAARFTTTSTTAQHQLHIQRSGIAGTVAVDLAEVTSLEELLGGPEGYHHIEIELRRAAAAQVVWPPSFTEIVLASLQATLDPAPSADPAPILVGAGATSGPPSASRPTVDLRVPRRRANAGLIGALALVGCGALIVGALGLRDPDPRVPAETKVLTQTTLRGPVTTVATTIPAAPTLPPVNECAPGAVTTTTGVDAEVIDGCEPG